MEDIYLHFAKRKPAGGGEKARAAGGNIRKEKFDLDAFAQSFIDTEKGVADLEEALTGARDIIANGK